MRLEGSDCGILKNFSIRWNEERRKIVRKKKETIVEYEPEIRKTTRMVEKSRDNEN